MHKEAFQRQYVHRLRIIVRPDERDEVQEVEIAGAEKYQLPTIPTRILLTMSRNPENDGVVNHQLVNLIDSNSAYIKNLIMRHLHKMRGITDKTREHIISKCKHDANFVIRMVCDEVEKDVAEE